MVVLFQCWLCSGVVLSDWVCILCVGCVWVILFFDWLCGVSWLGVGVSWLGVGVLLAGWAKEQMNNNKHNRQIAVNSLP